MVLDDRLLDCQAGAQVRLSARSPQLEPVATLDPVASPCRSSSALSGTSAARDTGWPACWALRAMTLPRRAALFWQIFIRLVLRVMTAMLAVVAEESQGGSACCAMCRLR